MTSPFASLRHRNFRLFWCGQCISQIGTWMQNVAQDWLVLQLTNSSFKLGLLVAAKFVPMMVLPLLAGVVAERYPKRNILLITQSCLTLQAVIMAVLTWTGVIRYEYVVVLVFCWGIVNGFDMPTRQAIVMELASREDLMNAIALNSAVFNAARLVGPALAGLALMRFGTAGCFALNAVSFLAVIAGLALIPAGQAGQSAPGVALAEIASGLRYIWARRTIRESLLLMTILNVFAMNFNVLIPTFAKFTLAGDSRTLGYLWAVIGVGALCGAIILATMSHRGPQRWMLVVYALGLCLGEIGISFTRSFSLAVPFVVLTGLSMTSFNATANTTLQINADDRFRSRVMSIYAMVLGGFTAFGSIIAGSIAQEAGPPAAFLTGGTVGIMGLMVMLAIWYRRWRREMKGQDVGRIMDQSSSPM